MNEADLIDAYGMREAESAPHIVTTPLRMDRIFDRLRRIDGHWLWTGARSGTGYPELDGQGVHRLLYELVNDVVLAPKDLLAHTAECVHRTCVYPEHLVLTSAERRPFLTAIARATATPRASWRSRDPARVRRHEAIAGAIPYDPEVAERVARRVEKLRSA